MKATTRMFPWVCLVAVAVMIFCFSTSSFSAAATEQILGSFNHFGRKLAHVSEYAFLFLVMRFALSHVWPSRTMFVVLVSFILCSLFAVSDEWHQSFVPNRGASWVDVAIDTGGALLGALLYGAYRLLANTWQKQR